MLRAIASRILWRELNALEQYRATIDQHRRWLGCMPDVCRVLENIRAEVEQSPDRRAVRIPQLRDEIESLRATQLLEWAAEQPPANPINLEGLTDRLLAPREIVRDADGWLSHPAMPICDEGVRYDKFLSAFGMQAHFCAMDGDAPPDAVERYFNGEGAEQGNCRSWTPTPPEGDGWVLLEIYDTEDGPHAVFARREPKQ